MFSPKIENGIFVVTGVTTLLAFIVNNGGSASGIIFLAVILYLMIRAAVFIWFILTGKLKRMDEEAKGHYPGLFFLYLAGMLVIPYLFIEIIEDVFGLKKGPELGALMILILLAYMFGGWKLIAWISPDEKS